MGHPGASRLLEEVIRRARPWWDYEVEHDFPSIGRRTMLVMRTGFSIRITNSRTLLLSIVDAHGATPA